MTFAFCVCVCVCADLLISMKTSVYSFKVLETTRNMEGSFQKSTIYRNPMEPLALFV